jgi:ribosomal protein S27E
MYLWDTKDQDNGEFTIQVRSTDSFGSTSGIQEITVTVSNAPDLSITITSPTNNKIIKSKAAQIIQGTTTGEGITKVEIKIGADAYITATDSTGDWSQWSYTWDTTGLKDATYTIRVRVTGVGSETKEDAIQVRLDLVSDAETPDTPSEDGIIDMITGLGTMMLAACGAIILIIILLIVFMVTRSKKKRMIREHEEKEQRLEMERLELERKEVELAEAEETKREAKKQPVRCPKCKEYSVIEDDGQRPMMIECVHCGAKGYISETPKKLSEPKLPEEEDKLIIECPKCNEMFTVEDETGEIACPNCGVRGQLDEETIAELKKQQKEDAEKTETEPKDKDELIDQIKSEKKIRCPNCATKFNIAADATSIECPSCGATGSL